MDKLILLGSASAFVWYESLEDEFTGINRPILKAEARTLCLIAMAINPETKYKQGTGDIMILGY